MASRDKKTLMAAAVALMFTALIIGSSVGHIGVSVETKNFTGTAPSDRRGTRLTINDYMEIDTAKYSEDILINSGGHLVLLENGSIDMLNSYDFQFSIQVYGTLELRDNSVISSDNKLALHLMPGSKLIMASGSKLDFQGYINATQARIEVTGGEIGTSSNQPTLNLDCLRFILFDAKVYATEDIILHITPGPRNDDSSTNDEFSIIDTDIEASGDLNITTERDTLNNIQPLEIVNSTVPTINVGNADTVIYLYRWLDIYVEDYFSRLPVGGYTVNYTYLNPGADNLPPIEPPSTNVLEYLGFPSNGTPEYFTGNGQGHCRIAMIGDTLSSTNNGGMPYFVGNYNLHASFEDQMLNRTYEYEKTISFDPFPSSGGGYAPSMSISINFTGELIPPQNTYFSQKHDSSSPVTDPNAKINSDQPITGDLVVEGSGHLKVTNATLTVQQTESQKYYILVKDSGVLELEDSTLLSTYPLNIYLYDNATLKMTRCGLGGDMWINMIAARGNTHIHIEDSILFGNINSIGAESTIIGSEITAFGTDNPDKGHMASMEVPSIQMDDRDVSIVSSKISTEEGYFSFDIKGDHYDNITIKDSMMDCTNKDSDYISIEKSTLSAMNVSFYGLWFNNAHGIITNLTRIQDGKELVPVIADAQTTIEKYWWAFVTLIDRYGAPVGGSMSSNTSDDIYVTVSPLLGGSNHPPVDTNDKGVAAFWLKSNEITKAQDRFVGKYRFEAIFRETSSYIINKSVVISINQTKHVTIQLDQGAYLYIQSVEAKKPKIELNVNVPLKAYIVNDGDLKATHVRVEFHIDGRLHSVDYINVPSKVSDNPIAVASSEWIPKTIGKHIVEVRVDPEYYDISKKTHFIVYGERDRVVEGAERISGDEENPYYISYFLLVYNSDPTATSTLDVDGYIIVDEEKDYEYEITVGEQGLLNITLANINSTAAVNISLEGNGALSITDSMVDLNGGKIISLSTDSSSVVTITNSVIYGSLDLVGSKLIIKNSRILGFGQMNLSFDSIIIEDTFIVYDSVDVKCTSFSASNVLLSGPIIFTGQTVARLTNVSMFQFDAQGQFYDSMTERNYLVYPLEYGGVGNAKIYLYWWLDLYVNDLVHLPVAGAEVELLDEDENEITEPDICYFVNGLELQEATNGTTDTMGHARFKILGKVFTNIDGNTTVGVYIIHVNAVNPITGKAAPTQRSKLTIVDEDVKRYINFTEPFHYPTSYEINMTIEPSLEEYTGGESVLVSIIVSQVFNGATYGPVHGATVEIVITDESGNVVTNVGTWYTGPNGTYQNTVTLPKNTGTYTLRITAWEEGNEGAKGMVNATFVVKAQEKVTTDNTGMVITAVGIVVVIGIILAIVLLILRARKARRSAWEDEEDWEDEEEDEEDIF